MPRIKKLPPKAILIPDPMWAVAKERADREFKTPEVVLIDAIYRILGKEIDALRAPQATEDNPLKSKDIALPEDIERSNRGTGFKGVYPHGRRFRAMYLQSSLGVFDTPEQAALERYNAIRAERDQVAESEEKRVAQEEAVAREEARNLQKFYDSAPKVRYGDGPPQTAPLEVTPEMEAKIEAHVAAGRMTRPEGLVVRDQNRARAKRKRGEPAAVTPDEAATINERVQRQGLSLFKPSGD